MQTSLASWLQAISTTVLAALAIWVGFFSEVGDLAIQRLQSDLLKTELQMDAIRKEKKELETQKQRLQDERNKLAQDREEHVIQVTNARLGDLWNHGIRMLRAYKNVAESSQKLWDFSKAVEPYRNWYKGKKIEHSGVHWYLPFPDPNESYTGQQSEWGEHVIDWYTGDWWSCSIDHAYVFKGRDDVEFDPQDSQPNSRKRAELVAKWHQDLDAENERRTAEYEVSCFSEFENIVRQRIELIAGEAALTIKDFSDGLLQWLEANNAGEEVQQRIRDKLMKKISTNEKFANLSIQLRVAKGASLQEIEKKADQIIVNVKIARNWLDEATTGRYTWTKD